MRFETSQSTPPHLDRRLQWRMLSFVAMFGVAFFLLGTLFDDKPIATNSSSNPKRSTDDSTAIDYTVRDETAPPLRSDEVYITGDDTFAPPHERDQIWLEEQASRGKEWAETAVARERESARRRIRYNKRWLSGVKDNTVGVRRDESAAFFRLLDHVNRASPDDLTTGASTEIQYINLMSEPDRFRGEPITIDGDLWRLYEFDAGPNNYGFRTLYEAWVFTGDSGNHPYRIVTAHLPSSIHLGHDVRQPVRVTGFFFKREGYSSKGGMHVAPTLLAASLIPLRLASSMPPNDSVMPYAMRIVAAIGLAMLVTLFAFAFGDRRFRRDSRDRHFSGAAPSFEGIDLIPSVSVEESLRLLSNSHRHALLQDEIVASGRDAGSVATSVLYRRDPHASVPPPVPQPELTDEELKRRHVAQANVLQDWTSRQGAGVEAGLLDSRESSAERDARRWSLAQRQREKIDTDRVIENLSPEDSAMPSVENHDYRSFSLKDDATSQHVSDATDSLKSREVTRSGIRGQQISGAESNEINPRIGDNSSKPISHTDDSSSDDATSYSLGASKLAKWEREIQEFSSTGRSKSEADSIGRSSDKTFNRHSNQQDSESHSDLKAQSSSASSSEQAAAARAARTELQRERFVREQQLRRQQQLEQQQKQSKDQSTQLEYESDETTRRQEFNRHQSIESRTNEQNQIDRERQEHLRIERDRSAASERDRFDREKSERERQQREEFEKQRIERERIEFEHRERERIERDRKERERLEAQRIERDRIERDRLERNRQYQERLENERLERERRKAEEQAQRERERFEREQEYQRQREERERNRERDRRRDDSDADAQESTLEEQLTDDEFFEEEILEETSNDDSDDSSSKSSKKSGWARYNEQRAKRKRRRRGDR